MRRAGWPRADAVSDEGVTNYGRGCPDCGFRVDLQEICSRQLTRSVGFVLRGKASAPGSFRASSGLETPSVTARKRSYGGTCALVERPLRRPPFSPLHVFLCLHLHIYFLHINTSQLCKKVKEGRRERNPGGCTGSAYTVTTYVQELRGHGVAPVKASRDMHSASCCAW